MYARLDPHWAGTLLALLQVLIIPIPVLFYKYGHRIRKRSALIQNMQRDKAKLDGKRAKILLSKDIEKMAEVEAEKNIA